jgi:predicted RNA binding protein YcfA (HicA-like mRNA interferase family)
MGNKQIVLSGKEFVRLLEKMGFVVVRINGSHHRMRHEDGRVTTIPVHKNDDLPKGLMRKIIREDLKIGLEEFEVLLKAIG